MKRLNPDTGKPFVYGDIRADGFLFFSYRYSRLKKNGYFGEDWVSPTMFDRKKETDKTWRQSNREKVCGYTKTWQRLNLEKVAVTKKVWQQSNPEKVNAANAKRRSSKLQRTPPWLTHKQLQEIENVYALAKQLTEETGILHHVDHIVPLLGKTVSGLHVPWNLRAIPATENQIKSNTHCAG